MVTRTVQHESAEELLVGETNLLGHESTGSGKGRNLTGQIWAIPIGESRR